MNSRVFAVTILAFSAMFYSHAGAASRDDVLEQLGKCAAIADNTARLACYDAMSPHVKDALATPPATIDHPPTQDEQKSWFGFDLDNLFGAAPQQQTTLDKFGSDTLPAIQEKKETAENAINNISAGVIQYYFSPIGRFVVELDNGQIWRQLTGDTAQAHFNANGKNTVTIERGALDSYNLTINTGHRAFKVTRVK
jgi:hypothetical protein